MECVLLAGQIACGKSTVAASLARASGGKHVRVREALGQVLGAGADDRYRLQVEGLELDRRTTGMWLVEYIEALGDVSSPLIIDAMRTERQTLPVLRSLRCSLVFLDASSTTRHRRFREAVDGGDPVKRSMSFSAAMRHPTESEVLRLRSRATLVISTDDRSADDVVEEVLMTLGIARPPTPLRRK